MTSHGQCPRGGACECPTRVGAFFKLMTSRGQCPRGVCVLVNVQEWGCFSIFRRADDVTRTMSKGGGACECPRVGAFFKLMTSRGQCPRGGGVRECLHTPPSGNPVSAPGVPPIQVQPPPHLDGWLRA